MNREPLPNPDIMIRERQGLLLFVPETVRGEEWLIVRAAGKSDVARPEAKLDTDDRIAAVGHRGGFRGFVVSREYAPALEVHVLAAGLVVRREIPS